MIGRLRHFLLIEAPEESDDGAGGANRIWVTVGQAWGKIETLAGRERLADDREAASQRHRIIVRYRDDLTPAHRFVWAGRHFDIESVSDRDGRKHFLVCECVAEEGS